MQHETVPNIQELQANTFSWGNDGRLQYPLDLDTPQLYWQSPKSVCRGLVGLKNREILYQLMRCDERTLRNELALLAQSVQINMYDETIIPGLIPLYNCVYFVLRFQKTTVFNLDTIDKIMKNCDFCTGKPERELSPLGWFEDQFPRKV